MHGRDRTGRLLVDVRALSGRSYGAGTVVRLVGTPSGVDACVDSEWFPVRWWEFTEGEVEVEAMATSPPQRGDEAA